MNLSYTLATVVLAVAFLVAAIGKWIQPKAAKSTIGLMALTERPAFAWMQIGCAAILLLPVPYLVHALAAAFMGTIIVLGQVLRVLRPEEECECFGSLTPRSPIVMGVLSLLIAGCCAIVIWRASSSPMAYPVFTWPALIFVTVCAFVIERKMRFDLLTGAGFAGRMVDLSDITSLPPDLELGESNGVTYTVGKASGTGKPTLILAVSSHCSACAKIYAGLESASSRFAPHVTMIAISRDSKLYANERSHILRLITHTDALSRFLGLRAKPYAIYLRPDMTLFTEPVQGEHSVARLLTIIGNQIP